ncbi:DNA polymerase III subunit gamma/tau [Caulobacter vibrioides]|uniref:DNA polymerase III subunit gamma/tau n=1 Tax=Caulobacter vibrioides TaxID=155892 RepID=UPI000C766538|nr:DNA polymerase III subunit gamma/tau [Caulobacter vibrioides]AVG21502.1 DNA polymerase III subunit gamma/tau [Caulobacter vibrioides]AZH11484.1 DNA polymerase III subunit gamma/tau [Caulobacter vibrioides]PLR13054.1 DNA polymerase III subunit gamma/tau [Caulobacter vibrioides]
MADHDDLSPDSAPPWDEAPAERDENTADIFGDAPAPAAEARPVVETPPEGEKGDAYTVLARKYRPRTFEDLIGQEAMVRTLANAFSTGRIAHAFMLTGVRGVGKTTTARLLARALNYETDTVKGPSVDLTVEGYHCRSIIEGRHMDVLELDAASRTKVDEMRELLDGVRYAPVEARYKVYIIDEVHMLSTAAFNALLKTLEEPPPHAKFIFATTEIRKVPVTILSRCQRFDLRRVEPDVLVKHFDRISAKEGARIEMDALALIARAAEGSVRDGLSLLDQAIVQTERGQTVTSTVVRDMLGLADRSQTIALYEHVMAGKTKDALEGFRALWGFGADPAVVMLDVLDHCHASAVSKALGPDALSMPKEQAARLAAIGAHTSAGTLSRLWQMLLKAHDEVRRAPDAMAAAEMALIRLCYAADLPGPEEALKALRDGAPVGGGGPGGGVAIGGGGAGGATASAQSPVMMAAPGAQAMPVLASFDDVMALIAAKRDIGLRLDVEQYVRPINFRPGALTFEAAPGAPGNLAGRLVRFLKEHSGQPWLVAAEGGGGAESLMERQKREEREALEAIKQDPFVASVLSAFPGAEIVEIRKILTPETAPLEPDEEEG